MRGYEWGYRKGRIRKGDVGNDNGNQEKYHGERSQDRRRSRRNYGGEGKTRGGEEGKTREGEE